MLDLAGGRAVHARGGDRSRYAPVRSVLASEDGDALSLARAYRTELELRQLYVADLDAITGGRMQVDLLAQISEAFDGGIMIDAGSATLDVSTRIRSLGATVVVGLETLPDFAVLAQIAADGATCFSLDLKDRQPVLHPSMSIHMAGSPTALAQQAQRAGVSDILVLDLGRVGSGKGPDSALVAEVRGAVSGVRVLAGGGVRNWTDLESLGAAGCDATLVGTALHEGRIGRREA